MGDPGQRTASLLRKHLHVDVPDSILAACCCYSTPECDFDRPVEADYLLDAKGGGFWGGQILPDSIPVADNCFGDFILLRFRPDGSLREPVFWSHLDGSWHPVDLGEAYPCRVARLMPQAFQALESPFRRFLADRGGGLDNLLALERPAESSLWLADTARIPTEYREQLSTLASVEDSDAFFFQDWKRAHALAAECHQLRPDLAWPGALIGWFHERAGRIKEAAEWYAQSLSNMGTTLAETEAWWGSGVRFAAGRLRVCLDTLGQKCPEHLTPMLSENDFGDAVRRNWMNRGRAFLKDGDGLRAYESFYRAGWDWYFTDDMEEVLDHLVRAAELAGSRALTAIARLHRARL